jgi:hypothetical protein
MSPIPAQRPILLDRDRALSDQGRFVAVLVQVNGYTDMVTTGF